MEDLNESDQWETLKRWLKENGAWIIGGVVLGAGGLLVWRWHDARVTAQSQAAAVEFNKLETALNAGKGPEVNKIAGQLQQQYDSTPYADHAELIVARLHVEKGEFDKAVEVLRSVMNGTGDRYLKQVARVRLARVELAQGKPDAALSTLGDAEDAGAFASAFNEVRGDALLAKGDRKGALEAYQTALLEAGGSGGGEDGQLQLKINDLTTVADLKANPPSPAGSPPK